MHRRNQDPSCAIEARRRPRPFFDADIGKAEQVPRDTHEILRSKIIKRAQNPFEFEYYRQGYENHLRLRQNSICKPTFSRLRQTSMPNPSSTRVRSTLRLTSARMTLPSSVKSSWQPGVIPGRCRISAGMTTCPLSETVTVVVTEIASCMVRIKMKRVHGCMESIPRLCMGIRCNHPYSRKIGTITRSIPRKQSQSVGKRMGANVEIGQRRSPFPAILAILHKCPSG